MSFISWKILVVSRQFVFLLCSKPDMLCTVFVFVFGLDLAGTPHFSVSPLPYIVSFDASSNFTHLFCLKADYYWMYLHLNDSIAILFTAAVEQILYWMNLHWKKKTQDLLASYCFYTTKLNQLLDVSASSRLNSHPLHNGGRADFVLDESAMKKTLRFTCTQRYCFYTTKSNQLYKLFSFSKM